MIRIFLNLDYTIRPKNGINVYIMERLKRMGSILIFILDSKAIRMNQKPVIKKRTPTNFQSRVISKLRGVRLPVSLNINGVL